MSGVVLASAGYDHTIRFWDAASGTCNRTVKYPDSVSFQLFNYRICFVFNVEFLSIASQLFTNNTR
jgi:WD40 repeat protein